MKSIELDNLDNRRKEEEEEEEEETDFGGESDKNNLLDSPDSLSNRDRKVIDINHLDPLRNLFGNRVYEGRNIGFFIEDVLLMEKEYTNPRFIKYLMETRDFTIKKTIRASKNVSNFEIEYYGEPYINENGIRVRPPRNFKTTDGVICDPNESNQIVNDI